ncbi:MAG: sugar porter family MFS transporter [Bacteroidota bacterium]
MSSKQFYTVQVALIVALGGFLMGFDASVISGVVKFIESDFNLTKIQVGWAVSSLSWVAALAMLVSGPLSNKFGRKLMLQIAAVLYAISAICSAIAPSYITLVIARMIGGVGVGMSLILAPMYIAEIAPSEMRGRLVSFNQLNIVIGITVAYFTNYLILELGQSASEWAVSMRFDEYNWRWMLGLETLPAVLYFFGMLFVPESPRWQIMKGQEEKALVTMEKVVSPDEASQQLADVKESLFAEQERESASLTELFKPAFRLVLLIGIVVAVLQQITGINSVFFYAPMIFEQSGIGTDASFVQAILVGVVNLVFTVLAIMYIDKLGRRPLLIAGIGGIAFFMLLLAYGFGTATYNLSEESLANLEGVNVEQLQSIVGNTYDNDIDFKVATEQALGAEDARKLESQLITASIKMDPTLILVGILGFIASFAISLGPVMWVLFSELFPMKVKGIAISLVGFLNSIVSSMVQLVFPWELSTFGNSTTFLIYGLFAVVGLLFVIRMVPETKGKTLEELEKVLVKS